MSFETRLWGLRLRSNLPLSGLIEASDADSADVTVNFYDGPLTNTPEVAAVDWHAQPLLETAYGAHRVFVGAGRAGRFWRLWYGSKSRCQSVEFVIDPKGCRIWVFRQSWGSQRELIKLQDVTTLLLGSPLGMLLRLRGIICLHGSVVAVGSRAVVILGNKGMGKSSMAAALAERGHAILSDDIAAITKSDGSYMVHPGYPRLRLWPETLHALKIDAEFTPVLPDLDKGYVDLNAQEAKTTRRFQSRPMPVGAIFLLTYDAGLNAPAIEPVAAADRLATLLDQTSVRFLPLDEAQRAQEFAQLSGLAIAVKFLRMKRPDGLDHLPAQCEAIANTVNKFAVTAA